MANKQPFYHRAVVLFTATRGLTPEELQTALRAALKSHRGMTTIITNTIEVEECDGEPGDPADLL